MSFYDVDFTVFWKNLLPSRKRLAKYLALGDPLTLPLQWNHDLFFTDYLSGAVYDNYDSLISYVPGNRVIYTDRSVYECILSTTGNDPSNELYWILIQTIFIGVRERELSTAQVISFESILNRYFQTPVGPQIYITNGTYISNCFIIGITETESSAIHVNESEDEEAIYSAANYGGIDYIIHVPNVVWTPLAGNDPDREAIVRSVADIYNLAGKIYSVVNY